MVLEWRGLWCSPHIFYLDKLQREGVLPFNFVVYILSISNFYDLCILALHHMKAFELIIQYSFSHFVCYLPDEDIDECSTWPCENDGACLNSDGSYSCTCVEGWTGINCDKGEILKHTNANNHHHHWSL